MVTRLRPAQTLIRAMVAGRNLSTVPNPLPPGCRSFELEQVDQ